MQQSTKLEQREILHSQLNAEETPKQNSSQLVEREQIEGTPFWIIGNTEDGYKLIMGKYQLTQNFKEKYEIHNHIEKHKWDITLQMILIVNSDTNKNQQNEKANTKLPEKNSN